MLPHLLLAFDFPPMSGGISRWMAELARHYPPQGLVVSTGQFDGSEDFDETFPNRIDRLSVASRRLKSIPGLLLWSRRVATLCRSLAPGFIWCGNVKPAAYPASWARERTGVPYGVIVHGFDLYRLQHQSHQSAVKRRIARALIKPAAVIVANSRYTRDLCLNVCREIGADRDSSEIRVVPLGTDPAYFRPGVDTSSIRVRYGLSEGRWLLTVARLVSHKGVDTVIRALAELANQLPDLRYVVVGEGGSQSQFEALAGKLGVGDRVRFLTGVPDRDLPALYNLAEVYLGVSRQAESMVEGFGISLVEASACGLPVIGGRSGGIPDTVKEGETGILVDPDSAQATAEGIRRILQDTALARRLGAGGRRAVETYFNWTRVTEDMMRIAEEFSVQAPTPPRAR